MEKKEFRVAIEIRGYATQVVKAESEEEAIKIASENPMAFGDDAYYWLPQKNKILDVATTEESNSLDDMVTEDGIKKDACKVSYTIFYVDDDPQHTKRVEKVCKSKDEAMAYILDWFNDGLDDPMTIDKLREDFSITENSFGEDGWYFEIV